MPKTRMTPFARLLLFLIFFVPVAFVGVSYLNGEDPIASVKNVLGMNDAPATEPVRDAPASAGSATFENVQDLRDELKLTQQKLAITEEKLARCRATEVE